jgi:hypothetical protein
MTVQFKIGDPAAAAQRTAMVHDKIASGHEFSLFRQILAVCTQLAEPLLDDTALLSKTGEISRFPQQLRMLTSEEVVNRAETITALALLKAKQYGWIIETANIDEIFPDNPKAFEPVR